MSVSPLEFECPSCLVLRGHACINLKVNDGSHVTWPHKSRRLRAKNYGRAVELYGNFLKAVESGRKNSE